MQARKTREHLFTQGLKSFQCPPKGTWSADYVPLHLPGLMHGERLTFSLYLKAGDNQFDGFKFFPYMDKGEVLASKQYQERGYSDIQRIKTGEGDIFFLLKNFLRYCFIAGPGIIHTRFSLHR